MVTQSVQTQTALVRSGRDANIVVKPLTTTTLEGAFSSLLSVGVPFPWVVGGDTPEAEGPSGAGQGAPGQTRPADTPVTVNIRDGGRPPVTRVSGHLPVDRRQPVTMVPQVRASGHGLQVPDRKSPSLPQPGQK